jgi:hypothetical protein
MIDLFPYSPFAQCLSLFASCFETFHPDTHRSADPAIHTTAHSLIETTTGEKPEAGRTREGGKEQEVKGRDGLSIEDREK